MEPTVTLSLAQYEEMKARIEDLSSLLGKYEKALRTVLRPGYKDIGDFGKGKTIRVLVVSEERLKEFLTFDQIELQEPAEVKEPSADMKNREAVLAMQEYARKLLAKHGKIPENCWRKEGCIYNSSISRRYLQCRIKQGMSVEACYAEVTTEAAKNGPVDFLWQKGAWRANDDGE